MFTAKWVWSADRVAVLVRHVGPIERLKGKPGAASINEMLKDPLLNGATKRQLDNYFTKHIKKQ